jgi:hypothetical protein
VHEHLGETGRWLAGTIAGSWYEEGRGEGREERSAQAVVSALEARGFTLDGQVRARINPRA